MAARVAMEHLLRAGLAEGPTVDEAIRLFAQIRSTPDEGRAIDLLLDRDRRAPLPEPLAVALAAALVDRGESEAAASILARSSSNAGLVLRADLLARQGDIEAARLAIERVLLRDIDWPGARERHRRWRRVESRVAPVARPEAVDLRLSPDKGLSFQIVREVARGGAGIVYEAIDRDLGRRVALKLYHRAERDRTQLRHEACVAVLLRGRGIVEVFDVNLDEGWLAMRWAPLGALGAHLHAQNTTVAESMGLWALTLARALGRVHAAGWVHHDVKPANVLLLGPGEALLTDFATARRMGDPSPRGSLGYVSPERLAGRPSDPKDDVYAFGRVIEAALETHTRQSAQYALFRQVVRSCTGPDADRPIDAGKVATELAAELREPAP